MGESNRALRLTLCGNCDITLSDKTVKCTYVNNADAAFESGGRIENGTVQNTYEEMAQ